MRRARKHDNVLTGGREKWRVARGEVRKAARFPQSAQTHARLAALLKRSDFRVRVNVDTCGNNAIFCASKRNNIAFCHSRLTGTDCRRGRGLSCASQLGLPRARLTSEEKRK